MSTMLVGYDLKEGEDYSDLIKKLKDFGGWWHHLDSTWLITTDLSPVQVRDQLKPLLKRTDKLLVINVSGDAAAWHGFNDQGAKWIKDNL